MRMESQEGELVRDLTYRSPLVLVWVPGLVMARPFVGRSMTCLGYLLHDTLAEKVNINWLEENGIDGTGPPLAGPRKSQWDPPWGIV